MWIMNPWYTQLLLVVVQDLPRLFTLIIIRVLSIFLAFINQDAPTLFIFHDPH